MRGHSFTLQVKRLFSRGNQVSGHTWQTTGYRPANPPSSNGTITYPTTSQPITSTSTGTTGYIESSEGISPINSIVCELKHQRQIRPNYGAKKWPTFWEENEPNFKKWKFLEITAFFGMCIRQFDTKKIARSHRSSETGCYCVHTKISSCYNEPRSCLNLIF